MTSIRLCFGLLLVSVVTADNFCKTQSDFIPDAVLLPAPIPGETTTCSAYNTFLLGKVSGSTWADVSCNEIWETSWVLTWDRLPGEISSSATQYMRTQLWAYGRTCCGGWGGTATIVYCNVVAATVSLAGITAAQFDVAAQTAFKEVIATYLSICPETLSSHHRLTTTQCISKYVTITASSRRDVSVSFTVDTVSASEATTGATTLNTAITTNAATFKNALVAKGGNLASVTGTTTTSAPAATTTTSSSSGSSGSISPGALIGIIVAGVVLWAS